MNFFQKVSRIKFLFLFFVVIHRLYSTTPHTIIIDGNLSDWHFDELVYDDSCNDSPWGMQNELHRLYLTWDENHLYLGVSGIQKDGNNLIVYIDTDLHSGITDASQLKDPWNPEALWWWRRNNKFSPGFTPDFQWHLYQMKLDIGEGHGLFKLNSDNTTISLNGRTGIEQKSSGDGTPGKYAEAEIKIPWDILFDTSRFFPLSFPLGEELRIIVCMTGGMDDKGTSDSADDIFGSARDTIPDQKYPFPSEPWYVPVTIDTWITIQLDRNEGRCPLTKNIRIVDIGKDYLKLEWDKKLPQDTAEYYILYYSTISTNIKVSSITTKTNSVFLSNIFPETTYYCSVSYVEKGREAGISETFQFSLPRIFYFDYRPKKYFFPGRRLELVLKIPNFFLNDDIKFYYRTSKNENFLELLPFTISPSEIKFTIPPEKTFSSIEFYLTVNDIKLPFKGTNIVEINNLAKISLLPKKEEYLVIYDTSSAHIELKIPAQNFSKDIFIKYKPKIEFYELPALSEIEPVEVYEIYSNEHLYFSPSIEIKFCYFDLPVGYNKNDLKLYHYDGKNWSERHCTVEDNVVRSKIFSGGVYVLGVSRRSSIYSNTGPVKLLQVENNKFSLKGPFFNVIFNNSSNEKQIKIFDLNNRFIREVKSSSETISWDGRDENGEPVPPGLYIYQLKFGGEIITGVCVLTK